MSVAAVLFCWTQRIALPIFVVLKKICKAVTMTAETRMIAILARGITMLPILTIPLRKPGTVKGVAPQMTRASSVRMRPRITVPMTANTGEAMLRSGLKMPVATRTPNRNMAATVAMTATAGGAPMRRTNCPANT